MGKIIDENNKPVPGARVKVSKAGNIVTEVVADNDGLYYTQLLPSGYYTVDIIANDKLVKAKKVFLKEQDKIKWYYNLKLQGEKAEVIVTANDPFMAHKLSKIEEKPELFDYQSHSRGGFTMRVTTDTATGKIMGVSGNNPPEAPPHVR